MMDDAFESSRAVTGLHLQGLECSSADSRRRDFVVVCRDTRVEDVLDRARDERRFMGL
jgi:hypothetical protein